MFPGATPKILQFSSEDIKEDCQIIEVEDGERVAPKLQTGINYDNYQIRYEKLTRFMISLLLQLC